MLSGSRSSRIVESTPIFDAIKESWVQPLEKPTFSSPPTSGHPRGPTLILQADIISRAQPNRPIVTAALALPNKKAAP